ncbi:unnamed protein product [Microthlaspi erraticum]|uniref:Uncharacterized protein n=1 Tax=Microthlaspi erraticum TaxID=1685480 RepID=A0A6D2I1I9_9BRAS|nr:unnamed protein product [Microthlaspi erraticum]
MEAKIGGSKQQQPSTPAPPPSTRRPRVREVSSRFMSSVSSSSSSAGDLYFSTSNSPNHNHHHQQRSVSAQRLRRQLKMGDADENRSIPETASRSLDSPFTLTKQSQSKPFKENSHRLDAAPTPIVPPPSKSRLSQHRLLTASPATRLLQLSGISASFPSSPLSSCNGRESGLFSRLGSSLPPVAPNTKIPVESKKQRKVSEQLEDVHSLKLLHNRHLQWRFANANAQVKTQTQRAQTEAMLYSFGLKISELNDSAQSKRIELQCLSRVKALLAVTDSQSPCLEQWSAIEEEYSASLSQTIQALSNASLRLPLDADINVENKELADALVGASKVLDGITQNVGNYTSMAKEMEILVSELARVNSRGRSLTEDCGLELLKTQASHIEECSLRIQLIQHQKKSLVTGTQNSCSLGRDFS